MSLFKINRGDSSNLPTSFHDGWAYFCTDTGEFFIDHPNNENTIVRTKISANYAERLRYEKNGEYIEINIEDLVTNIIDGDGIESLESPTGGIAYSEKSIAFGDGVTAGYKGYYIKYIDFTHHRIHLSTTKFETFGDTSIDANVILPTDVVGLKFSIVNGSHYPYCGTIEGVTDNTVHYTSDDLGFTELVYDDGTDGNTFFIPTRPDVGINDIIFGDHTVVFGRGNKGSGSDSIIVGRDNVLVSNYAAVFGRGNVVGYAGICSGRNNLVTGLDAGTFGHGNKATGQAAFATNAGNEASGRASFASGEGTKSKGFASSSEGMATIANGNGQHVQGKFNKEDTEGRYAHIVGNGADDYNRWNAHTLDWNGNAWFRGDVYSSGENQDNSYKLAKINEVNQAMADAVADSIDNSYKTLNLTHPLYEGTVFNRKCYKFDGLSASISVFHTNDTNGIKFARMVPINNDKGIYFSYWDFSNPISVKDGLIYFKLMMRTTGINEDFVLAPTISIIRSTDSDGNILFTEIIGQTEKLYTDTNGWDNYLITIKCPNVVSFSQIQVYFAAIEAKMQNVGENARFDIAGWTAFDDITKAKTYDMTYSCSSSYLKGYNIQGQIDAKASNDLSNVTSDALKNLGAAPMYTYGTEDIEAGSASTSPTGTLHFVYE